MSGIVKLLVVANPGVDSEEVRDPIVERAAAGPVHVTLVEPSAVGTVPLCVPHATGAGAVERTRRASATGLQRAVAQLRDAGVAVEGSAGAVKRAAARPAWRLLGPQPRPRSASADKADLLTVWNVVRAAFGEHDPPSTLLGVAALGYDRQLVEVEAVATVPS